MKNLKIQKVSYGKTFNLGEFQSERIDLEGVIEVDENGDSEDPVKAIKYIRKLVYEGSEFADRQKRAAKSG